MQIFHNLNEWSAFRRQLPQQSTLGFAPTMGNLHPGHASLFKAAKTENDYCVATIFVNPTQFNNKEDYIHYPRTIEADLAIAKESGVDFCILPVEEALYPDAYNYQIHENELSKIMEGSHRPGHFSGVLTIVMKLLNLVKPNCAYFGEKDYQQLLLIREMVSAFFMDIKIHSCPTIRESSGLAYSSRNNRLSPPQKLLAETFARIFHQGKEPESIIKALHAQGIEVDYIQDVGDRRFAAVKIGTIRLIDNYSLSS